MLRKETLELCKFQTVENFVGKELYGFVEERLGIDFRKALEGEITPYVQNLIDNSYYFDVQKGSRTDLQMVKELVYSRCVELRLLEKWKKQMVVLNGSDKDCLITRYASNASDMWEVGTSNYYEIMSTYKGYCLNSENLYISKGKLQKLSEHAKNSIQYLVVVDVLFRKYCFIPVRGNISEMDYVEPSPLGNGYNVSLEGVDWFMLEEEEDLIVGSIC